MAVEDEHNLCEVDVEVEPLLAVLLGKAMEQAMVEVEEEEELNAKPEAKVLLCTADSLPCRVSTVAQHVNWEVVVESVSRQ